MALETISGNHINVKTINLPDVEGRGLVYDYENELDSQDWLSSVNQVNEKLQSSYEQDFMTGMHRLRDMKLVSPSLYGRFFNNMSEDTYYRYKANLTRAVNNINTAIGSYYDFAPEFKILFPERLNEIPVEEKHFIGIKDRIRKFMSEGYIAGFSEYCVSMKILFPHRESEFEVTNQDIQAWKDEIRKAKMWGKSGQQTSGSIYFLELASAFKIFLPERFGELKINQSDIELAKRLVSEYRGNSDYQGLMNTALYLKIITTDEIKVTDTGIEFITTNKIPHEPSQRLPERRKF